MAAPSKLLPFSLGKHLIDPPLLLAPMAGHTHVGFRTLVRELGSCGLVFSELISSHALRVAPASRKARELFDWSPQEIPFGVQLFGSVPEEMAEAALKVQQEGAPLVDINMGCWVPKIAKNGGGAALLDNLRLAARVVQAVVAAVSIPVSVKIRLGFKAGKPTAIDFARAAAEAGVAMITVHGRYADQGFRGESQHEITATIRQELPPSIKVIANGDIVDVSSAMAIASTTGCDGLMLGRAALYRPWLFSEIAEALCDDKKARVKKTPLEVARRHIELTQQLVNKPEWLIVRELRGQLLPYRLGEGLYQNGLSLEQEIRKQIVSAKSIDDFKRLLDFAVHSI